MNHQPPAVLSQYLRFDRSRNFHPSTVTPRVVTGNAFYVPGNLVMAMAVVVLVVLVMVNILFGNFGNIPYVEVAAAFRALKDIERA